MDIINNIFLEAAFRATTYRVDTPGESFRLRIGEPNPAFAATLERHCIRSWAIVTACNPGGRLTPQDNAADTAKLLAIIERHGWRKFAACNLPDGADWPSEPGFCILDADEDEVTALAAAFGQLAIVTGKRIDAVPTLLWL